MAQKAKPVQVDLSQKGDPAVRKLQEELKQQGFFPYPVDGIAGEKTSAGVEKRNAAQQAEREAGNRSAEASARAEEAKARAKEADAAKEAPGAQVARFATEFGPWAAGAGAGYGLSRYMGSKFDTQDATQANAVNRLASSKNINPMIANSELDNINKARNWRSGKQFLGPLALAGSAAFTRDVVAPQFDEDTRKYINLAATAENAAGMTLGAKQLMDLATRGNPNDPVDVAKIRSAALPPPQPAPTNALLPPAPSAPAPTQPPVSPQTAPAPVQAQRPRHERLNAAARAAGATSPMNKADAAAFIAQNINDTNRAEIARALGVSHKGPNLPSRIAMAVSDMAPRGRSSVLLPLTAGALAYDAVRSPSEAAGGQTAAGSVGQGLAAGVGAAGLTAGGMKVANMLSPTVNSAIGIGMEGMAPVAVNQMTDDFASPEARNWAARNFPRALQFGAVDDAYQMAQVPSRRPADAPQPSPEPAPAPQELSQDDFEAQMSDLDSLLKQIGAEQSDGPVRQSMRSQAVAQQPSFIPQNGMMQPAQAQDPYANNRLMMARY